MARRPPKFVLGLAGAEAAKLKKFSDAGETQIWWLSDAARNRFFRLFRYKESIQMTLDISLVSSYTRSHNQLGRGKRVSKPNRRYTEEDDNNGKERVARKTASHWRAKALPYSVPASANQYSYGKAPRRKTLKMSQPQMPNGRQYTDKIEFISDKSHQAFLRIWQKTPRPKQNKSFVDRCQKYFSDLHKSADPALKWVKIVPSKDPDLGMGVVATQKIKEGTLIGHYAGFMKKLQDSDSRYIFKITGIDLGHWYIDAADKGNYLTCVNANETNPNVAVQEYYDKEGPRIIFMADRDIEKEEELFISYGEAYWKNIGFNPKTID